MDTPQSPIDHDSVNQSSERKNKLFKPGSVILAVLILVGGYWLLTSVMGQKSSPGETQTLTNNAVTSEQKTSGLTPEEKAELEKKLGEYHAAIGKLTPQTAVAEKDKLYLQLASTQWSLGMYQEALASLGNMSAEYNNPARVNITYALVYRDMGDLAKAAEYAKKALDLDPENPQHWIVYLETDQQLNNGNREFKYQEALEKTGNHEDVYVSYAKFLELIGDIDGAIEQYQKAGAVKPSQKAEFDAEIERLRSK